MSYYSFLEEYYMGKLVLGKVGGPDDCALFLSLACFLTAYGGSVELWGQPVKLQGETLTIFGIEDICWGPFAITCIMTFTFINTFCSFIPSVYACRNDAIFRKRYTAVSFFANTSFMIVLIAIYLAYTQLSGSTILISNPKLTTCAYGG